MQEPSIIPLGDSAVIVRFGHKIDDEVHARVMALVGYLDRTPFEGLIDHYPAYASVTVHYDPLSARGADERSPRESVVLMLRDACRKLEPASTPEREIIIPVCYDRSLALDLTEVANTLGCNEEDVVKLHSSTSYRCYMIGFLPGFPYLGTLPAELQLPRRDRPRAMVPAGSVAIAGAQTGIYPQESPGGWHCIGRTPLKLFYPDRNPPALLHPGDRVQFVPISREEYEAQLARQS